jgi:transcription antitermination factor NusG
MWYVIRSKPKQESNLYKLISHHNVFYPRYKKTNSSYAPYFDQYLFLHSNDILKDVNYLKYSRGLHSFLKVNDTYQSISDDYMERLQSFFDDNGVLFPDYKINQKVKLLDPVFKDLEFIVKERLSTNRLILLTELFNHNIKVTVSSEHITI